MYCTSDTVVTFYSSADIPLKHIMDLYKSAKEKNMGSKLLEKLAKSRILTVESMRVEVNLLMFGGVCHPSLSACSFSVKV